MYSSSVRGRRRSASGMLVCMRKRITFTKIIDLSQNAEGRAVRLAYPRWQLFDCEEVRVAMTHIGGYPGRYERGVEAQLRLRRPKIFVSGHSHILKVIYDRRNDWLHINPGAAGLSGFHQVRTAVRLTIDGADIRDLEVGEWPRRLKL